MLVFYYIFTECVVIVISGQVGFPWRGVLSEHFVQPFSQNLNEADELMSSWRTGSLRREREEYTTAFRLEMKTKSFSSRTDSSVFLDIHKGYITLLQDISRSYRIYLAPIGYISLLQDISLSHPGYIRVILVPHQATRTVVFIIYYFKINRFK